MITTLASLLLSPATLQTPETTEIKVPGTLVTFKMVKVPAGKIVVDGKEIEVKAHWFGQTEVTWDLYDIYAFRLDLTADQNAKGVDAKTRPSKPYGAPDRGFGHSGYAALGMTANSANHFCEWLSQKTGKKFRIPTEAEWEFAARAGVTGDPASLNEIAWWWENSDDAAQPVGSKKANPWGIFDTIGNVWEWVMAVDGTEVVAGGAYNSKQVDLGFGVRKKFDPKWQEADAHVPKSKWWLSDGPHIGMRLVAEL